MWVLSFDQSKKSDFSSLWVSYNDIFLRRNPGPSPKKSCEIHVFRDVFLVEHSVQSLSPQICATGTAKARRRSMDGRSTEFAAAERRSNFVVWGRKTAKIVEISRKSGGESEATGSNESGYLCVAQ